MKQTKTILMLFLPLLMGFASPAQVLEEQNYIRVDQFGYTPNSQKVAVIAQAVEGFNAGSGIDLDTSKPLELRTVSDDSVAFMSHPKAWNGGEEDSYSGDKGWWFDFSAFTTPGEYYIRVYKNGGGSVDSYHFKIAKDVYNAVLRAAVNMFYYQRANIDKTAQYASGVKWTDGPWFENSKQAIDINDESKTRDVSRGWIDAGDPNMYVTFALPAVHNLLTTYDQHKDFWKNFDLNIPESNNTVPDLLDEVKWEIDYLENMQDYPGTGGLHIKSGVKTDDYISPPSTDDRKRYYGPLCPSASVAGAGMMAHAALEFKDQPELASYAVELTLRAEAAWKYYSDSPDKEEECDNGEIKAGDADGDGAHYAKEHLAEGTCAAIYLYALTGKSEYSDFVKQNYTQTRPWMAGDWGIYRTNQSEALMFYITMPNADPDVKAAIIAKKESSDFSQGSAYEQVESDNLYMAKAYYDNWGSNSLMSRQGADNMDFVEYGLLPDQHARFRKKAEGYIHYINGVNPFGMTYLSNMYQYGAEFSANEMWHSWFKPDTKYDNIDNGNIGPAPGYLVGGFNVYNAKTAKVKIGVDEFDTTTGDQPPQKSYTGDNDGKYTPWAFNEPGIYYNASFVKLLADFVASAQDYAYHIDASGNHGKVTPSSGGYNDGDVAVLTAHAEPGYHFTNWSGDANGSDNPLKIGVDGDKNITANFAANDPDECGIFNNGFESGYSGWVNNGGTEISNDEHTGNKAMEINGAGGIAMDAPVLLGANKGYNLAFYAKASDDVDDATVGIDFLDADGQVLARQTVNAFDHDYKEKTLSGTAPEGTYALRVWAWKTGVKSSGNLLLDDFCLKLSEKPLYRLVVDGGSGSGYYNAGDVVDVVADSHDGAGFDKWAGNVAGLADVRGGATKFTMSDTAAILFATYSFNDEDTLSPATMHAKMVDGGAGYLALKQDDVAVRVWLVEGTDYADYMAMIGGDHDVKLFYVENGHEVQVDYLKINSDGYQAESQKVNTSVQVGGHCGGQYSDIMHCTGYIDFGQVDAVVITGLDGQFKGRQLQVYPNPTAPGSVVIDLDKAQGTILTITDLNGHKLLGRELDQDISIVDTRGFAPGLYLLHFSTDGQKLTRKLVVR